MVIEIKFAGRLFLSSSKKDDHAHVWMTAGESERERWNVWSELYGGCVCAHTSSIWLRGSQANLFLLSFSGVREGWTKPFPLRTVLC